ncbi:MAG: hypothetical protein M3Q47_07630 [Actinomycetota bacterium]|nr:hypothetical protein [Actinomycetota bacterium]
MLAALAVEGGQEGRVVGEVQVAHPGVPERDPEESLAEQELMQLVVAVGQVAQHQGGRSGRVLLGAGGLQHHAQRAAPVRGPVQPQVFTPGQQGAHAEDR